MFRLCDGGVFRSHTEDARDPRRVTITSTVSSARLTSNSFKNWPFVARLNQYKCRETIAAVPRYGHVRVQIVGSLDNARRSVNTTSDIAAYSAGGPFGPPKRQDKA